MQFSTIIRTKVCNKSIALATKALKKIQTLRTGGSELIKY